MNELYKRIEVLCKNKKINITTMCTEANLPRGALTDLKMGRTETLSTKSLGKLSAYFGVSIDYLIGAEKKEPVSQEANGLHSVGYNDLTPENQRLIDSMIEKLLKSQYGE